MEESLPTGRVPLPSSVTKDLLRASASRSSRGGTSMTPTPRHAVAAEGQRSSPLKLSSPSVDKERPRPSSSKRQSRPSSDRRRIRDMETSDDERGTNVKSGNSQLDDSDGSDGFSILETVPRAGPSRLVHGPRRDSTDPLVLDARARSSISSSPPASSLRSASASSSHHSRPMPIAKYKGAPYVEIPYIPLATLRRYSKPAKDRKSVV